MRDVANETLSERLFKWSGWADLPAEQWYGYEAPTYTLPVRIGRTPAYDLGYLLRKLPGYFKLQRSTLPGQLGWEIYHSEKNIYFADTPENVACKLAIELFKQGVLK